MTLDEQLETLRSSLQTRIQDGTRKIEVSSEPQPSGAVLILIKGYQLPPGWSMDVVTILFLAPPGYPAAQPDCFWVEPVGLRLKNNNQTPQATNDSNPIPGIGPRGTWFSWHVQGWNPNEDTLLRYFHVIEDRLKKIQ